MAEIFPDSLGGDAFQQIIDYNVARNSLIEDTVVKVVADDKRIANYVKSVRASDYKDETRDAYLMSMQKYIGTTYDLLPDYLPDVCLAITVNELAKSKRKGQ